MNTFDFFKNPIFKRIKKIINIIILIVAGLMTVCGQMPAFDPVTFEYIGEYLFWKNPLAIYWYVLLPSAAIAFSQYNEPEFYKSNEKKFDLVLLLIFFLTIFAVIYHYVKYF